MLSQGESYAEFKESVSRPPFLDAVRMINGQTELIGEVLNQPLNSDIQRRQAIVYLLEQCILLSAAIPSKKRREMRRFQLVQRQIEKIRRVVRGDNL